MPYLAKKTWIEMAPKISGLSVPESPYGMGQACDPSDYACQIAQLPVAASGSYTSDVNSILNAAATSPVGTNIPFSLSSSSNIALWVLIGGGVLLAIAVAAGGRR
jgi:hypothetical protein